MDKKSIEKFVLALRRPKFSTSDPWVVLQKRTSQNFDLFIFRRFIGVQSPILVIFGDLGPFLTLKSAIFREKTKKSKFWLVRFWRTTQGSLVPNLGLLSAKTNFSIDFWVIYYWKKSIFVIYRDFPIFSENTLISNSCHFARRNDN